MHVRTPFILLALLLPFAGCDSVNAPDESAAKAPVFPDPKQSPERTEFEKIATKRNELSIKRKTLAAVQKSEQNRQLEKNPIVMSESDPGGSTPPPPRTPEQRENSRLIRELRGEQAKIETELNIEFLKFSENEYFPAVRKYAKFCHKAFIAEPNKANGGELYELADILYENGDLEQAYLYATDLLKHGFESAEIYDLATAAAYCTEHFVESIEFFEKAMAHGPCRRTLLVAVVSEFDESKKAWEIEKDIRAKEAAADDLPRVKLETDVGDMVYELFENEAPETVGNFISLVESGRYDDTTFFGISLTVGVYHGLISGEREEGIGYNIFPESNKPNHRFPFRGSLVSQVRNEHDNPSIYGIMFRSSPYSFGNFTTYGRVVEGIDVLAKIAKYNARTPMPGMEPTKVIKATVLRKRDHEYKPHKVETASTGS